jgi:hypothetical protein
MEPLETALRPSFILLGCIDEEAIHDSPRGEQAVSGQHPKLKLQNMGGGELKTGYMRPCQNTTIRILWRTTSTSHFFVCKVWIFRSFNGGVFLLFFMPLFSEGFMEFKRGGFLLMFQRGGLKNDFARRGSFIGPPPLFTLPAPPPASRNNSIFRSARDGIF